MLICELPTVSAIELKRPEILYGPRHYLRLPAPATLPCKTLSPHQRRSAALTNLSLVSANDYGILMGIGL